MRLEDLIDLEAQLVRDRDADPAALAARDRAVLPARAAREPRRREALLAGWVHALRDAEPDRFHPGRAIARALRLVRLGVAVLGLVLGWGGATALFRYTGGHPVNVWDVLLALVGVQLALLVLLALALLFPVATLGAPLLGLLRDAVAATYPRLAGRALGPARADEWRALWHRLRSRRSLYHAVEPWLLLSATQGFGVAFNVGALAACLRLVVFSDVAFGWSTTLVRLDGATFHGIVEAIAAPFGWLWPDAVPSRALVDATRYSRLEGAYLQAGAGRAADPALVGGWWRFLLASVAAYGLLPRAAALLFSRLRAARALRRLPLDDAEVSRVVRRLTEPHVELGTGAPAEAPVAERGAISAALPLDGGAAVTVVLWRDAPAGPSLEAAVSRETGRPVAGLRAAGGRDDAEGAAALAALARGDGPVVVVAEAFEAPDRAALRFVAALRAAAGPRRPVLVLVVAPAAAGPAPAPPDEVRVWRDRLARLEDPFLAVGTLRGAP